MNEATLIGHLGQDPETRYLTDGKAVCNFSLATTEKWKDKNGEKQEKTEWHKIILFGRQAEIANEYLTKGAAVFVRGRLQTRKWTDRDGVERYVTEIIGDRLQMLGSKPAEQQNQSSDKAGHSGRSQQPGGFDDEDDIPF